MKKLFRHGPWVRTLKPHKQGWYWTPWTYRFGHGGWVFVVPREPWKAARWLWKFRNAPHYTVMESHYGTYIPGPGRDEQ